MKTCFKCHKEKELDEFYAHPRMKDGHLNKCKECTKIDVRRDRQQSESARKYDAKRYRENPERRKNIIDSSIKRRKANPLKTKAQNKVYNEIRSGRMKRPSTCPFCGKSEHRIEAHHDDYTKPLAIVWACTPCHRVLDGKSKALPDDAVLM